MSVRGGRDGELALVELSRRWDAVQLGEDALVDQVGDGALNLVFKVIHILVRVDGAKSDLGDVGLDGPGVGDAPLLDSVRDELHDVAGDGGEGELSTG